MILESACHPRVHDDLSNSQQPGQNTDRRAPCQEVLHHLPGDCLRIARHPLGDHAVVGCRHDDGLASDPRFLGAEDPGQLNRHLLQAAQAAWRLGETDLPGLGAASRFSVRGPDPADGLFERDRFHSGWVEPWLSSTMPGPVRDTGQKENSNPAVPVAPGFRKPFS